LSKPVTKVYGYILGENINYKKLNVFTYKGLEKDEITKVFQQFTADNLDEKLDKNEFTRLILRLRSFKPNESVEKITEYVFKAFDIDSNLKTNIV
jgi:hypothetical protein